MLKRSRRRRVFAKRRTNRALPLLLGALLIGGAATGGYLLLRSEPGFDVERHEALVAPQPVCKIPAEILERVANGYVPGRSGDVLAVEQLPNQFGTRHSSPHPYHQDVPVALYGPGFIRKGVTSDRPVTVADLAPTYAELLGFDDFPVEEREGKPLTEALLPEDKRNGVPRLIITLVWDGGGDNVLELWPDHWPNLQRMMDGGTLYTEATVGSSPSITPAIHANMGTGAFPKTHGIPDTRIRVKGEMLDAWEGSSPRFLRIQTLADLYDAALGNEPLIGMMARDPWHLGMIGHGSFTEGGDKDIAVMDELGGTRFRTNPDFYSMPEYMEDMSGLQDAVDVVDLRDGEKDGRWLGNPILSFDANVRFTPAWSIFQTDRLLELLTNEGFGRDEVPDLFYVNYKPIDLAGHLWNMVDPEVRDNVEESDRQLPRLLDWLDENVGRKNYVVAYTSDHGMTPTPTVTKGWSIEIRDMSEDIERRFDKVTPNIPLILSNRGYQIMLNQNELERNDITAADVAEFVRRYRIEDNITPTNTVLPRFEGRTEERLYLTALTPEELEEALECAREEQGGDEAQSLRSERAVRNALTRKSGFPST